MSRTSVTDQLADLRRAYTGENLSQAVPAVREAAREVPRDQLTAALRGERADVPVLLPEAATGVQRELEARVLTAACGASSYLQLRPPASIVRPAHVFSAVEPGATVRLHLNPHALGPLLFELLPRVEAGYQMGVAGLRHRQHPRSAELYLEDASVVLAGVDAYAWAAGMRWVEWMIGFRGFETRLGEAGATERDPMPSAQLGSALLRRIHLFAGASWVRMFAQEHAWWLEWPGGPEAELVARRLRHPLFGMAGADAVRLRRTDVPAQDVDAQLASYPWPEEFVSAVTADVPGRAPGRR